jgi:hypothetical protein
MGETEIERLIADLREMLARQGFGWAVDEAEEELYIGVASRTRALALIEAAEGVTVDLADIEVRLINEFVSENIKFNSDQADPETDAGTDQARVRQSLSEKDELQGPTRTTVLLDLASHRETFLSLRRRLDGFD